MPVENARWKLHKDAAWCFEQILEAALYQTGHLSPISQTIQARHAVYHWESKGKLKREVLLWMPAYGYTSVGSPAWKTVLVNWVSINSKVVCIHLYWYS